MKKVGVLFGGRSVEHEVSVITAMQIIENMDKTKYDPIPVYVDKDGRWLTGRSLLSFKSFKENNLKDTKRIMLSGIHGDGNLYLHPEEAGIFGKKVFDKVDIFFPAFHGTNGEDGSVQGLLELLNLPYAGAGVLASAVGMDKIVMKDVYKANDLPVVEFLWFYRSQWISGKSQVIEEIEKKLGYPVFVKPANLGSSIGISKAKNREMLEFAFQIAASYDRKLIIEKAVENPREINCAVLGYDDQVEASLCEEPIGWTDLLSFDDKYIRGDKSEKGEDSKRAIPANIPDDMRKQIENLAKHAFMAIDGRGNARIDFLLAENGSVYVNEINTLPGSLAFYLWEGKGYDFKTLIDKMIEIALITHKEKEKNMYTFDSNLFARTQFGSKTGKM
ncbi:D-alanine--D-alanine ligase family protein [Gudongella oleilytica]|uniref:D-alanine--D-alanine ligase family protein n=1 Tax=Gudongella oleilytica TaxID=1582259 RepID=UPI000FF8A846|nr:D-alanine--D-alanine ligase family protein [Gudongella oleilytica]